MIEFFMSLEPTLCIAHEAKQSTATVFHLNLFLALPELRDNEKPVHMSLRIHTYTHKSFSYKIINAFFADSGILDSSDKTPEKCTEI